MTTKNGSLPKLLVSIRQHGKAQRTVFFKDPRAEFCRLYNKSMAELGSEAVPLDNSNPFAEALAEFKSRRYTLAWVDDDGEVERTFGEYRESEVADLEEVVARYREIRDTDPTIELDLQVVAVGEGEQFVGAND